MDWLLSSAFLFAAVLQTSILLLAAQGALISQQANVLNIGLDGMMLMGAFTAIAVGASTGSALLAVIAAAVAGLLVATVFGVVSLYMRADIIVVGIGIGTLTTGLSVLLLSTLFGSEGAYVPRGFPKLWKLDLGPLADVPVLGPALHGQSILAVLAFVLVPVGWYVLYRTRFGLRVRAVGEDPEAAVAAGISPRRIQLATILIAGIFCGIAGAQLSMATLGQFIIGMTAGRGFIALAAIFVGRARPLGTLLGCVVFGFASATANELQIKGLPSDLMLMLPYLVTVAVLMIPPIRQRLVRRRQARATA